MPAILMVVTSHAKLPNGTPTGLWLEELAASYYVFADAGCSLAVASPHGGAVPVDPLSLSEPWLTAEGRRFRADAAAMSLMGDTRRLDSIDPDDWDAMYLVGGVATAWDYPSDTHLSASVSALFSSGKPVAAVCHGVLGLTGARNGAGQPIVDGRAVTGISNAEETLTGFDKIVPVLPESRLRELGAQYSCAAPLECHVVSDENLLTGQNPASAGPLARKVLARIR
jgi:putative intracellular protease/amidase